MMIKQLKNVIETKLTSVTSDKDAVLDRVGGRDLLDNYDKRSQLALNLLNSNRPPLYVLAQVQFVIFISYGLKTCCA